MTPLQRRLASFTLIELLVVMVIIFILVAMTIWAGSAVMQKGYRSRAASEIQAMSTALEGYKTDNGIYAQSDGALLTNNYVNYDGTMVNYQTNSTLLYMALSGQTNYATSPAAGTKSYMSFKINQVGNASGPFSYIKDPWGYSYGYSTGTTNGATTPMYPYNGNGFFDVWSTGGKLQSVANTNLWISNWQ